MALVRGPFSEKFLDTLPYFTRLDAQTEDILRYCLLYQRNEGEFILHEKLRDEAKKWLDDKKKQQIHTDLAEFYTKEFERKNDITALSDEMEAFHHATAARQKDILNRFRPFFVDQLDELGHALSRTKRYAEAVEVFERAAQWDNNDDYAHHYLAYNLDIQGIEVKRVEEGYCRAIELNHRHVWWHSRWVCFLITRGPANKYIKLSGMHWMC